MQLLVYLIFIALIVFLALIIRRSTPPYVYFPYILESEPVQTLPAPAAEKLILIFDTAFATRALCACGLVLIDVNFGNAHRPAVSR